MKDKKIDGEEETDKKVDLAMNLWELSELPDFNKRDGMGGRVRNGLQNIYGCSCKEYGYRRMKTLRDLKNYVEEYGWLISRNYRTTKLKLIGEKSVHYFNQVLKKYGIEPFEPLIKD